MVEDILTDEHMSLHLDKSTNQVQHAQSVIASIPRAFRFKIGITRCPTWRYYTAPYGYNKFYFRQKDGVDYEHMLIIHISHSREVVAMLEHGLIVHFQDHEPRRCANRKNDLDDHLHDDSNSEDERGGGPYVVYVALGKRL